MKSLVPLFLVLVACGATDQPPTGSTSVPEAAPAAAPVDAEPAHAEAGSTACATGTEPGSHDDWCAGHGVPESQCTRCNPDLIPAFEAVGDWCDEHGLPMSQCTVCNPDLVIERPPKEG
jgi:hypothetical protein